MGVLSRQVSLYHFWEQHKTTFRLYKIMNFFSQWRWKFGIVTLKCRTFETCFMKMYTLISRLVYINHKLYQWQLLKPDLLMLLSTNNITQVPEVKNNAWFLFQIQSTKGGSKQWVDLMLRAWKNLREVQAVYTCRLKMHSIKLHVRHSKLLYVLKYSMHFMPVDCLWQLHRSSRNLRQTCHWEFFKSWY